MTEAAIDRVDPVQQSKQELLDAAQRRLSKAEERLDRAENPVLRGVLGTVVQIRMIQRDALEYKLTGKIES